MFFVLMVLSLFANAQYTQVGQAPFTSSSYGPIISSTNPAYYSRMAYIWPVATLGNLQHGDSITAFSFSCYTFDTLRGNCNMKIYVKATNQADFGNGSLNWLAAQRDGMTLVYNGNPSAAIGDKPGYKTFIFNEVSAYTWDTTGAKENLQVLIQYTQNTNQVEPLQWDYDNNGSVTGFISGNEGKFIYGPSTSGLDSMTNINNIRKPTLRIHYPRYDSELELQNIYALGSLPLLMDRPDSVKVAVYNIGKNAVSNRDLYLRVGGANEFFDTTALDYIAPYERKMVYFTTYKPANLGTDSLRVTLAPDSNLQNNVLIKNVDVNYNVYSQADPFAGNSGGIGFSGETGDFVAKFYVHGSSYINQIKVDFNSNGVPFQLGVWEDDNGFPGSELFMSDTVLSSPGTFIMSVLPRVQVSGGFYVGIRQSSNTHVSFSFQEEKPVRPNTFYFTAPAGDTTWTNFSPGFDFNFNIRPRLQVANDLAVLSVGSPQDQDSILYDNNDSIPLLATIINYGYQNQGSFLVKYELLNQYNQIIFSRTEQTGLDAEDTTTISFGKFSKYNLGKFTARASVSLSTDSVVDNNQRSIEFYLIKKHDVLVNRIFEPGNEDVFDLNRDYFHPTARIVNAGVVAQQNFDIVIELLNPQGQVVDSQTLVTSLLPENSIILNFDSMILREEGVHTLQIYTDLARDSFRINDTLRISLISRKVDDMLISSISVPQNSTKYGLGNNVTPFVDFRNDGINSYDSVLLVSTITGVGKLELYRDTVYKNPSFFSTGQAVFKPYLLDSLGDFSFFVEVFLEEDQKHQNDTMRSNFSVAVPNDLQIVELVEPLSLNEHGKSSDNLKLKIANRGLNDVSDAMVSLEIRDLANQVIYTDTGAVEVASFQDVILILDSVDFNTVGDYYVRAINLWSEESLPSSNDTLETTYDVRYSKDIDVVEHREVLDNEQLFLLSEVKPRIFIANNGLDSMEDVALEVNIKNEGNNIVFSDTLRIAVLRAYEGVELTSIRSFVAKEPGEFTMQTRLLNTDDFSLNNSLSTTFEVVLRYDAEASMARLPTEDTALRILTVYQPQIGIANNGALDLTGVLIQCRVSVEGTEIYSDLQTVQLNATESATVLFDSTLSYHIKSADALAEFICLYSQDEVRENDTLRVNFKFIESLGIDELFYGTVKVYPNPFYQSFGIVAEKPIDAARVYDMNGKIVWENKHVRNNTLRVRLEQPAGPYILEIEQGALMRKFSLLKEQ